jgi:hypothetical protein
MEITSNGIEFEWNAHNSSGARFTLYAERGRHTEEDVALARQWLYHNRDVVSIQVRWKMLDDKVAPPEKIPDFIIIKELKVEIGKLKAQIDELEDANVKLAREGVTQVKREIVKEELYTALKSENTKRKNEICKLRQEISTLVTRLRASGDPRALT